MKKKIAIVGLGLMGGSLAAVCRKKFPKSRVVGITRKRSAIRGAIRKKWIHEGSTDLKRGIADADLIVLCTPINTLPGLLEKIDRAAKPGAVVTDVGSFKSNIVRQIRKKNWKQIRFISAHPMMGSHEKGFSAARTNLYDRGYVFVIRPPKADPKNFVFVKNFWKKINPRVTVVTAEEHDRIVSLISHLPHILSVCVVLAVGRKDLRFASSGFRDMTRIAKGNPSIWVPILRTNQKALWRAWAIFSRHLRNFQKFQRSKNPARVRKMLTKAARDRSQI